jgi:hypothetical protein
MSSEPPLLVSRGRDDVGVMAFAQLRFGEEPVFDVMPVFTAVRLKQAIRALANGCGREGRSKIRLGAELLAERGATVFFFNITILNGYG